MTKQTREKWAERVREWRESGLTAETFTEGKDYKASSLRVAESQLKELNTSKSPSRRGTRVATTVAKGSQAPGFLPIRLGTARAVGPDVVVEVGGASIRVGRGSDLQLVGALVRALQGAHR